MRLSHSKNDLLESLLRARNLEVSLRYVLKHANYGCSNVFQLFDTTEKAESPRCKAEDDGWKVRGETMRGRTVRETSGTTLGIKEPRQKLRRVPTALCRLLCLSNARRRPEKKKIIGELREERRRRRIAFEKPGLTYLDNCNEVKVGITELQERVEVPAQIGISIQQVAQQAMNEDGQTIVEVFWQEE